MITTKNLLIAFAFILTSVGAFSQKINYFNAPENYQLYARDNADSATVYVSGQLDKGKSYDAITLKVFKDGVLFDTRESAINGRKFEVKSRINAGLFQFRFELLFYQDEIRKTVILADSVVCGDAYIVTGQSNSHASSSFATFSSPYCRSFGVKTGYEAYSEDDKKVRWGRASGSCPGLNGVGGWFKKNPYGVGVWGMELARLIVEKHRIPVCIINGGSGSSSIEQNMLYPERISLETSFGRLAYRVTQAGLKDNVKAIFWHQGETNSDRRYSTYAENFDILYSDWKRVYTGLQKIYAFQLHPGCGGEFQSEMREIQHQNARRYNDVEIMSTTGVVGHDGCHFSTEGYYEFAQRILPLVSRDFYDAKSHAKLTPPTLLNAFYKNEKEIILEFDQAVKLEESKKVKGEEYFMKDQFFFRMKDNDEAIGNRVKNVDVRNKQIVLLLENETIYDNITWLPNKNYKGTKICYNGPWIRGSENNIGALSFDRRNINKPMALQRTEKAKWHGFEIQDSTLNGVPFKVVFPKTANKKRNWIWRARFWGHQPQTDIALLEQGFHLVYIEVGGLFGNPKAIGIWDDFYAFATKQYQLNPKVVLEGMSRGGLPIFNWGNKNAEKVACIYGDAPVCDFKSWPGGLGNGKGSPRDWKICLEQYGFSKEQALQYEGNPVDCMENIAKYKVPVLNVVGDADDVVPVSENTDKLKARLKTLGWEMKVIHKPGVGHHPHSLQDPKSIVDFILQSTGNAVKRVNSGPQWSLNNITLRNGFQNAKHQFEKNKKGHVAFIGGSITEMEGYRPKLWRYLEAKFPETDFSFTDAGIGSTCSNTGAFRFDRDVLSKGPLDLLFVEFAVNDDQDAAHTYEQALMGMEGIIRHARKHNPDVNIVMTYFVNPEILNDYQHGKVRTSIQAHEAVAKQYNISTCNLAKEIAEQITIGTLDWETFGGTHPADFGNSICAGMVISLLEKGWGKTSELKKVEPMNEFSFENGKLLSPENCKFDKKWAFRIPDWQNIEGGKRSRFTNEKILSTTKKGAQLTLDFEGTAVGAYLLAGPDAGTIEVSIDGGDFQEVDLYHRYSKNLHYPRTVVFASKLSGGKHNLILRMLKKSSGKGNAMRVMYFAVNE